MLLEQSTLVEALGDLIIFLSYVVITLLQHVLQCFEAKFTELLQLSFLLRERFVGVIKRVWHHAGTDRGQILHVWRQVRLLIEIIVVFGRGAFYVVKSRRDIHASLPCRYRHLLLHHLV